MGNGITPTFGIISTSLDLGPAIANEYDSENHEKGMLRALDDTHEDVRSIIARSPSAGEAVLLKALDDTNTEIRKNAAANPAATETVLMKAMEDKDQFVRLAAVKNLNATERVMLTAFDHEDKFEPAIFAAIYHKNATPTVLLRGLSSRRTEIKAGAAENPNADINVLMVALDSDIPAVRDAARKNPACTDDVFAKIQTLRGQGGMTIGEQIALDPF